MSVSQVRHKRLARALQEKGLDTVILYGNAWQNDYLRYAADFAILEGEGIAVINSDGETTLYLDHPIEAERASVESPNVRVKLVDDLIGEIGGVIKRLGNRRTAAGPLRHLPRGLVATDKRFDDATDLLDRLLMVKDREELELIREAAVMADEGYAVFKEAARPGRKDYELISEIEAFYRSKGVDDNFMIIGVGGVEVRGMAPPSGKVLKKGDLVTTELTPCVGGYYSQICRTLAVGEPSETQLRVFSIYKEAMEAGIAVVRHGVTAADVARAENDVFRRYGLGDYVTDKFTRVRGHGLGLFPDTKPHILEDVNTVLEEGMSIIVHPNTYNPDVGYFVLGDALIVGKQGAEVLARTPRVLFAAGEGA